MNHWAKKLLVIYTRGKYHSVNIQHTIILYFRNIMHAWLSEACFVLCWPYFAKRYNHYQFFNCQRWHLLWWIRGGPLFGNGCDTIDVSQFLCCVINVPVSDNCHLPPPLSEMSKTCQLPSDNHIPPLGIFFMANSNYNCKQHRRPPLQHHPQNQKYTMISTSLEDK